MPESQPVYRVQILRGTEIANDQYTGPEGEITIDMTNKRIRIHDGLTTGGRALSNLEDLQALREELLEHISLVGGSGDEPLEGGAESTDLTEILARLDHLEAQMGQTTVESLRWAETVFEDYGVHPEDADVEVSLQAQYLYDNSNISYQLIHGDLPASFYVDNTHPNGVKLKGRTPNVKTLTPLQFSVNATAGSETIVLNGTLHVDGQNAPPTWITDGNLGEPEEGAYSTTLVADDPDGDNAALIYSLTTGTLPEGLTLFDDGTLSGTIPSTNTTYTFTVRAADESSHVERAFTLKTPELVVEYPGPTVLVGGTTTRGYFGRVSDFVTTTELCNQIGLSAGTLQNDNPVWLKFSWKGRPYYFPSRTLRNGVSWAALYALGVAGAPPGDLDYHPIDSLPWQSSMVTQNTEVVIGGIRYDIRLPRGLNENPTDVSTPSFDPSASHGCEWNRLLYHVFRQNLSSNDAGDTRVSEGIDDAVGGAWDDWANFAFQIGSVASHLDGRSIWCQETWYNGSTPVEQRIVRGQKGISYVSKFNGTYHNPGIGWRPVLVGLD